MDADIKSVVKFMWRTVLVALPVVVPIVALYLLTDPYKVLRSYDSYFPDPYSGQARIGVNKGVATLAAYEAGRRAGIEYNAFIFGSSISCYYDADTWGAMVSPDAEPIHFDAASETLPGIAAKLRYLSENGAPVDYALIVLDPLVLANPAPDSPFAIEPPAFRKGLCHWIKYHYTFFRAAANADFLKSILAYAATGVAVDNGRNMVFEPQPIVYDRVRNQENLPDWDKAISEAPDAFYAEHPLVESPACFVEGPQVIVGDNIDALNEISGTLEALGTDYRVVVTPNRRKVSMNHLDCAELLRCFGEDRVFDYSRSSDFELECDTLFYDNTHYRPVFAKRVLDMIYGK